MTSKNIDRSPSSRGAVLVVDDDEQYLGFLSALLESEGYSVCTLDGGAHVFDILEKQRFDLLIKDIVMPEKEGIELIFQLADRFPMLPVIAISGVGGPSKKVYLDAAVTAGAISAFLKPIDENKFLEEIARVFSGLPND